MPIKTDPFSATLRERGIDQEARRVLIANLEASDQAGDLTEPLNCSGFGRIRHFRRETAVGWPENPLPIDPAGRALGAGRPEVMRAQVFQNAVCNWRCWYCYVDFPLLSGNSDRASMLSAAELLDLLEAEDDPAAVLDLSGGQPDLVPEWVIWVAEEIDRRGLSKKLYLWSDDNLSNDYFWAHLDDAKRAVLSQRTHYGKVCCFKGFDERSFAFNTGAESMLFSRQFELFERLLTQTDIDLYAYATFTAPSDQGLESSMAAFVDRLQGIDPNLPLRLIPLRVEPFTPVRNRGIGEEHEASLRIQDQAVASWLSELSDRFSSTELKMPITEVGLRCD
jgi:uncharacterized Fe-S cluster-containing radical SAM superfamily protein